MHKSEIVITDVDEWTGEGDNLRGSEEHLNMAAEKRRNIDKIKIETTK